VARKIDDLETAITDITGASGNNGKLGALKDRVDKGEARRWWAITFLAGLLVTVIGSAVALGSWMGSIEQQVKAFHYRSHDSQPDDPAKDEGK
jgi:hypothetical protein